jgi:hypothetical protein
VLLPVIQGQQMTGANSIDIYDSGNGKGSNRIVVVAGDYTAPTSSKDNCFISDDGGRTWKAPKSPPHGYRSCVEYLSKKDLVCCGLTGVDYSANNGKTWDLISTESFNVCRIAKLGTAIYLAGNNGQIGKITWK